MLPVRPPEPRRNRRAPRGEEVGFEVERLAFLDGLDGEAGGDGADQGQLGMAFLVGQADLGINLQRACLVGLAQERALFDQGLDVLEDGHLAHVQLVGQFLHSR